MYGSQCELRNSVHEVDGSLTPPNYSPQRGHTVGPTDYPNNKHLQSHNISIKGGISTSEFVFENLHGGKDGLMQLKGETNKQTQNFFTVAPVCEECLGAPAALYHDHQWVNAQQEQVSCTSNSEAVTFG